LHKRLVAFQIIFPGQFRVTFIVFVIEVKSLNERFLLYTVKVFVDTIKNVVQKLLRVLLLVAIELWCEFCYNFFKLPGTNIRVASTPDLFHELSIGTRQLTLTAEWVVSINIFHKLVANHVLRQI
jgi:hypothetical protein